MVKKCTLIIPVHNHIELTKSALNDLNGKITGFTNFIFHVVIVDDGSTDGTSDWIRVHYPDIPVLPGDGNLWWSGGINTGTHYALEILNTDYIILWNNDITFESQYFTRLVKIMADTPEDVIIGSKILVYEKPDYIWSMGGYFNPFNGKYGMYSYFKRDEAISEIKEVDWLPGMGTIIHRNVIQNCGYWNQRDFPQYHGDSDFTYRAKLKGYKIKVFTDLILYNKVKNTGISSKNSFKALITTLTDIRSKSNFQKNYLFYRKYARSPVAYCKLLQSYFRVIFGFFKWKFLGWFGIKKVATI